MSSRPVNLLVFREDLRRVSGNALKAALLAELQSSPHAALTALLRAGELECGVADRNPELAGEWELLTDQLADTVLAPESLSLATSLVLAGEAEVPRQLEISKPEGFAYYALHPVAYADVLQQISPRREGVGVIGIRSIGTTLSAVTAAALRLHGTRAGRITVRPNGHPYNRRTAFSASQLEWVREMLARGSEFLVVDEGPGLSGSSFLSVAEALVEAGAPAQAINLIGGHPPEFAALCSDDAQNRACRYRWVAVNRQARIPDNPEVFLGAGEWRRWHFQHEDDWPASWTTLERLKYLKHGDRPERGLYKFAGFGHYGDRVLEREQRAAAAGYAIHPAPAEDGFAWYPWLEGTPMRPSHLSEGRLERLAAYCAFRAQAFAASEVVLGPLQQMATHNLEQMGFDWRPKLRLEKPAIADGRMQPHEWLLTVDGRMLKADSGSHGDDHFFPGPSDVAWDLAGAIVEWRMNSAQSEYFLEIYRRRSGDQAKLRINDFIIAYTVFRSAYCTMAANALETSFEGARLQRAASEYLSILSSLLPNQRPSQPLPESRAA